MESPNYMCEFNERNKEEATNSNSSVADQMRNTVTLSPSVAELWC